jgi:hypothetical protein
MSDRGSKSNKKRATSKPFLILAAFSFAAIVGLGFFRFNAAQLEYRLSGIEKSIEHYSVEEIELKRTLSGLTSPIKIYSYCKDRLGMNMAAQELVRVPGVLVAEAAAPVPQKGWRSNLFSFFGLMVN